MAAAGEDSICGCVRHPQPGPSGQHPGIRHIHRGVYRVFHQRTKTWSVKSTFKVLNKNLVKKLNPRSAKLSNLNFHPLEVVSR